MNTEPAKQASDKSVLLAELLDSNIPKSEREHVAVEEIHSLESLLHKQGWDIERLKITIKQLQNEIKLQNKDWCDDDEAIKQQALRVLPKEVVEGDSVHVPRMGELAEMMADEIERLRVWNNRWRDLAAKLQLSFKDWADETVKLKLENTELKQQLQESGDSDTWREACGRLESEITKLREENKQLRLGWCRESEKRQGEWHSESAKIPFINKDTITIRDTLCYYCHGAGQIEVRIVWDSKTPYSQQGWAVCRMCEGKGHL